MRIRDKLIHFLGGYTKSDYKNRPVNTVIKQEMPIRTIKVAYTLNSDYSEEEKKYIKEDMIIRLAKRMDEENLVLFKYQVDDPTINPHMYAIVRVIEPIE